jgi:hypothetical protein
MVQQSSLDGTRLASQYQCAAGTGTRAGQDARHSVSLAMAIEQLGHGDLL